ncbi:MAG: glycosyltransferase [Phycisphaerae bacterium]
MTTPVPLRILHISTRLILGGSQENTVLSCEGQARLGHRVHLAYGPIHGPEGSMLERVQAFNERCRRGEEQTESGGPVCPIVLHEVKHLVREVSLSSDRRCLRELKELIATLGPDVVHTHSSKAGILGRMAAWSVREAAEAPGSFASMRGHRGRLPAIVHTIHGPPFMPLEGRGLSRVKRAVANAVYAAAERLAARRCQRIISVADAMTRQFLAKGIGTPEQYVTVRSGMDTEPFLASWTARERAETRAEWGIQPHDFVIGTVARLAEHKGHDDLLEATAESLRANPSWKLLWVGDGWWRKRLLWRARELGLTVRELDLRHEDEGPCNLVVTGLVPPEQIPGLIKCMDVLVHPSLREGLPRTVPQALLAGVCPVAYDVDGTGEVCREMETGRLVKPGDVAGLRDAILWCAENDVAREALAARGRAECLGAFPAEVMIRRLEEVYAAAMTVP